VKKNVVAQNVEYLLNPESLVYRHRIIFFPRARGKNIRGARKERTGAGIIGGAGLVLVLGRAGRWTTISATSLAIAVAPSRHSGTRLTRVVFGASPIGPPHAHRLASSPRANERARGGRSGRVIGGDPPRRANLAEGISRARPFFEPPLVIRDRAP
jgi:hypothetical protein